MEKNMLEGGFVQFIDKLGSDLTVVNAARVSMGKFRKRLNDKDIKLIYYLADNHHTSPFRHVQLQMRMRMPIFVMRQFIRHRFGVEVNEISGRYVEFENDFYVPEVFRQGSPEIKQGSLDDEVEQAALARTIYLGQCRNALQAYKELLAMGVCKEQARMLLPLSLWTEFVCTMSLQAAAHFHFLRADSHAQREIQVYAHAIADQFKEHFPHSWGAMTQNKEAVSAQPREIQPQEIEAFEAS